MGYFRMSLKALSKRLLQALLGLMVLLTVLWTTSRLLGPTDAGEAALARIREPLPPVERNAFTALWLMPYDIPPAERDLVFAEDMKRFRAMPSASMPDPGIEIDAANQVSAAAQRFPSQEMTTEDSALFCRGHERCLAKVAADPVAFAALVERHAQLLDRVESLSQYDGLRHSFGLRFDMPFPPYQHGNLARTRHALLFVQGRREQAFEGVCRSIATWRRIGANSDNLISRMVGSAYGGETYPALFLEMLIQTPRDVVLPATCTQAFAPLTDAEASLCQAMRGEFVYQVSMAEQIGQGEINGDRSFPAALLPLVFSEEMTLADGAEVLGHFCLPEIQREMRADLLMPRIRESPGFLRLQCASNAMGCMLAEIAQPAFDRYSARVLDANAHLRLIALLLRLRADAGDTRTIFVKLRAMQDEVGSRVRELSLGAGGHTVRIRNYDTGRGEFREIPLPPYLQANPAVASP
jgi:hypothetical protein